MKTAKIIIKPLDPYINHIKFMSAFPIDGKIRAWLEDDTVKDFSPSDKLPRTKNITFRNIQRIFEISYPIYEITDDKNSIQKNEREYKMSNIYNTFLCKHPACLINGERHPYSNSNPLFNVVDVGKELNDKYDLFENKLRVINLVNNMDTTEREEVLYYYGQSPIGKDKAEILLRLVNFEDGLCIEKPKDFLQKWGAASEERQFIVNIRKALDLRIIEDRTTENGKGYYVGTNFAGIDVAGIMDYLRKNPKIYNDHVLRVISEKQIPVFAMATGDEVMKTNWTKEETEQLRAEAKDLVKTGFIDETVKYWSITIDKLMPHIVEGRKRKKAEEKKLQTT